MISNAGGGRSWVVLGCVALLGLAGSVKADTITLGATTYDVVLSTPGESISDYLGTLDTQPWWNNPGAAESAADQIGLDFGYQNFGVFGPMFIFGTGAPNMYTYVLDGGVEEGTDSDGYPSFTFAIVDGSSGVPDSGASVTLLGAGLIGLALLRRRLLCA